MICLESRVNAFVLALTGGCSEPMACCSDDVFLGGSHFVGVFRVEVVMARQMQEPVDHVGGEFFRRGVSEFRGAGMGDRGANEDLTIRECDDVGGTKDAKEFAVDCRHPAEANHRNLNAGEPVKGAPPGQ